MAALIERQLSASARWSRHIGYFALVLLAIAAGSHRFGFVATPTLIGVLGVVAVLAILALVLAAIGFASLWRRGDKAGMNATGGFLFAIIALTPFMAAGAGYLYFPELSDISTDLDRPPQITLGESLRGPMANPPGVPQMSQLDVQSEAYPEAIGRLFEAPPEQVSAVVLAEARDRGWISLNAPELNEEVREITYEFTARTFFYGFVSDVAVRISDEDEMALVDMRSASRYGRLDFGDNARRIESFLDAINQRLKSEPSAQAGL